MNKECRIFLIAMCLVSLFCVDLVLAETNLVRLDLPFTIHSDSNLANGINQGGTPTNAYDENFETNYGSPYNGSNGDVRHTVIVEVEFLFPVNLNRISYRMAAHAGGYSDYINICNYSMVVEFNIGGNWSAVPGSFHEGSGGQGDISYDTGHVDYTMPIENVDGLRATVYSYAYYTGGGSYFHAHSFVYELQGWGEAPSCSQNGDVNFSGTVTAGDAQTAFQIALGVVSPTEEEWCAADCNGDYTVTSADAQQIFLTVLGLDSCIDPIVD